MYLRIGRLYRLRSRIMLSRNLSMIKHYNPHVLINYQYFRTGLIP